MKQHIEIIDGKEVVVKVYAPRPTPKKVTAKVPGKRTQKQIIAKKRRQRGAK